MMPTLEVPTYRVVPVRKLYESVVDQIQAQIVSGQLRTGDQLPIEPELCETFHVSRTVIREAIQILQERGLVEVKQGMGTFVTQPATDIVTSALRLLTQLGGASTMEVVEVRDLLETEVAVLAARRSGPENHRQLEAYLHEMEENLENLCAFTEADVSFHRELAKASGNTVLELIVAPLYELMRDVRRSTFDVPGTPARALKHHWSIFRAVRDSDEQAARQAMRRHVEQVRDDVRRLDVEARPVRRRSR